MSEFKSEYLKSVPEFDGNPAELQRYLNTSENIINAFYDVNDLNNFQNTYIINSLINKLTGTAKIVINIQNVHSWVELKQTLTNHFADQRDEQCLNRDLILLKQMSGEKPQQFFDRCLHILNIICAYIDNHENSFDTKQVKREFYKTLTLRTFLAGLHDPLGTIIRGMRPHDLNEALQLIIQEENLRRFKSNYLPQNSQTQRHNNFSNNNVPQSKKFDFVNNPPNQTRFPSQPIQYTTRPVNQKFFTNKQVFGNPKPPLNNPNNVFAPKRNFVPQNKPTPMSTSTRQSNPQFNNHFQNQNQFQNQNRFQNQFQNQNRFQNQRPRQNFISEELFNAENENNESNSEQNYENENVYYENCEQEIDENEQQNFQETPESDDET